MDQEIGAFSTAIAVLSGSNPISAAAYGLVGGSVASWVVSWWRGGDKTSDVLKRDEQAQEAVNILIDRALTREREKKDREAALEQAKIGTIEVPALDDNSEI